MAEKKKKTIECDKSMLTFEVSFAQCHNGIAKYEKKNKGTTKWTIRLDPVMYNQEVNATKVFYGV